MKDMKKKKYCIGFNFKPEVYSNQKEPIFIGTYDEVQNWVKNFFKSIYK